MAGIYLHIPFCRQACHYCNFHFSVSRKQQKEFVESLQKEISIQKNFFNHEAVKTDNIKTLYFGGGTPSLLTFRELTQIMQTLQDNFTFDPECEITFECNPDDMSFDKTEMLKSIGMNRLSIGVQSFHSADLRYMNRLHSPAQSVKAIENAQRSGFENITTDLIYGTPTMSKQQWKENIQKITSLSVPHVSAYALTVEKKTALDVFIRKGTAMPVKDEKAEEDFHILCNMMKERGYVHYEISNFGKPGFFSQHNLNYWNGTPYLGLGPSAHSFLPGIRQWNVSNTCKYIDSLKKNRVPFEKEILSKTDQYNEYVMTSLRTMWGIEKQKINTNFDKKYETYLNHEASKQIIAGNLSETNTHFTITEKGRFFSDGIAASLFYDKSD